LLIVEGAVGSRDGAEGVLKTVRAGPFVQRVAIGLSCNLARFEGLNAIGQ